MAGKMLPETFRNATDLGVFEFETSKSFSRKMVFDNTDGAEVKNFFIGTVGIVDKAGFSYSPRYFSAYDWMFLGRSFRTYNRKLKGFSCVSKGVSVYQEPLKYVYFDNDFSDANVSEIEWQEGVENDEFNSLVQHFKCDIFLSPESALVFQVPPGEKLLLTFYLEDV